MTYINKALHIAVYHFRLLTVHVRIPIILVMIALFINENLRTVLLFSKAVNISVTPYAFPHLTNDYVCQLIIMAGAILLFCDAPFEGKESPYLLSRGGRFAWGAGQIVYMTGLAFFYVSFILIISILPFFGHLSFGEEWGKIWGTLAKTDAGAQFGVTLHVTEYMVSRYAARSAMMISFVLEWACVVWLGLLVYFFNKLTSRPIGTFTGAFCVLLDVCISNDWANWAYKFSPITLAQTNTYAGYNLQNNITFDYGIRFFSIGIVLLVLLCILANYKDKIWGRLTRHIRMRKV